MRRTLITSPIPPPCALALQLSQTVQRPQSAHCAIACKSLLALDSSRQYPVLLCHVRGDVALLVRNMFSMHCGRPGALSVSRSIMSPPVTICAPRLDRCDRFEAEIKSNFRGFCATLRTTNTCGGVPHARMRAAMLSHTLICDGGRQTGDGAALERCGKWAPVACAKRLSAAQRAVPASKRRDCLCFPSFEKKKRQKPSLLGCAALVLVTRPCRLVRRPDARIDEHVALV